MGRGALSLMTQLHLKGCSARVWHIGRDWPRRLNISMTPRGGLGSISSPHFGHVGDHMLRSLRQTQTGTRRVQRAKWRVDTLGERSKPLRRIPCDDGSAPHVYTQSGGGLIEDFSQLASIWPMGCSQDDWRIGTEHESSALQTAQALFPMRASGRSSVLVRCVDTYGLVAG